MLKAVGKFVMLEVVQDPKISAGGLHIPDAVANKTIRGKVVSLGKSALEFGLFLGDTVFYNQHAVGHRMKVDEKDVIFLPPEEIFAVDHFLPGIVPPMKTRQNKTVKKGKSK